MKILNTFTSINPYKINKQNLGQAAPSKQKNIINSTPSICNPYFYKSYNNISFGQNKEESSTQNYFILQDNTGSPVKIVNRHTLASGKTINITIGKSTIDRFFTRQNGDLDKDSIQKFISIFEAVLQNIIHQENQENEFLKSVIEGKNPTLPKDKISYLNPHDDIVNSMLSSLSTSSDAFIYSFINGIKDEKLRKDFAVELLTKTIQTPQEKYDKAMERTSCIFEMCKTPNGYDFSDIDKKMQLVLRIEDIERDYGVQDSEKDLTSEIIEHSKGTNGNFDVNFAQTLIELISNSNSFLPNKLVKHRSDIIKSFSAIDPEKHKEIISTITNLSAIFEIDDGNKDFESILIQAFNPITNKFDTKAATLLLELVPLVKEATDDMPIETEEDFKNYLLKQQELIKNYFEAVRDKQTGEIKQGYISPEEYIYD